MWFHYVRKAFLIPYLFVCLLFIDQLFTRIALSWIFVYDECLYLFTEEQYNYSSLHSSLHFTPGYLTPRCVHSGRYQQRQQLCFFNSLCWCTNTAFLHDYLRVVMPLSLYPAVRECWNLQRKLFDSTRCYLYNTFFIC